MCIQELTFDIPVISNKEIKPAYFWLTTEFILVFCSLHAWSGHKKKWTTKIKYDLMFWMVVEENNWINTKNLDQIP